MSTSNTSLLNSTSIAYSIEWPYALLSIFLILVTLLTIVGNLFVVYAVLYERHLRRNLTNWFLLSLALADLLMGSVVMPFAIVQLLFPNQWLFGQLWCDFWHAFDVLSSTASILNLCAIALERYWAICYKHVLFSKKKYYCVILLIFVWTCSCVISFPAIFWWKVTSDYVNYLDNVCRFTKNSTYLIVSSCISFYIPLVVMFVVYGHIYYTTTKLVKRFKNNQKIVDCVQAHPKKIASNTSNRPLKRKISVSYNNLVQFHPDNTDKLNHCVSNCSFCNLSNNNQSYCHHYKSNLSLNHTYGPNTCFKISSPIHLPIHFQSLNYLTSLNCQVDNSNHCTDLHTNTYTPPIDLCILQQDNPNNVNAFISNSNLKSDKPTINNVQSKTTKQWHFQLKMFTLTKYLNRLAREQKTARILAFIMTLFTGCWLPFFTCNLIVALEVYSINESNIFQTILILSTWLGYINSCLNPIVYAHSMKGFQRAFKHLVCCYYLNKHKHTKENRCKQKKPEFILYKVNNMTRFINKQPKFHSTLN